jgi:hypothetical protein
MTQRSFVWGGIAALLFLAVTPSAVGAPVYEFHFYPIQESPTALQFQTGAQFRLRIAQTVLDGFTAVNFDFFNFNLDRYVRTIYFDDVHNNILFNNFTTNNQGTRWAIDNNLGAAGPDFTGPSDNPAQLPGWNSFPLCQSPYPACTPWDTDFAAGARGPDRLIGPDQAVRITLALQPNQNLNHVRAAINGDGVYFNSVALRIGLFVQNEESWKFIAIPEPSTLSLLGAGLALMAGYAWRRRRANPPVV